MLMILAIKSKKKGLVTTLFFFFLKALAANIWKKQKPEGWCWTLMSLSELWPLGRFKPVSVQ